MRHFKVTFQPDGKQISIHEGATLLEAAGQAGIILNAACGGQGICEKCQVYLEPGAQQVLACQHHIQNDLTVNIPATSRFFEQKILQYGIPAQIKIHPTVCKKYLKIASPDPHQALAALNETSPDELYEITPTATAQLKQFDTRTLAQGITAVCHLDFDTYNSDARQHKYMVVGIEQGDTTDKMFGLAVDIGTTTVVAKLISLADGQCHTTQADLNPQIKYGDDVISRISYAQTDEKLDELQKAVIDCLNDLITRLCRLAAAEPKHIYEVCIVGNTTMNHIFLKLPLAQLGQAPYHAFSLDAHDRAADELGMQISPAANVHTVENIAGFVGSDTLAVALAVDINSADKTTLVIDIGTNGELILGTKDKLYAASCAAGPAFEGARITQGSRAVEGAIEAVVINENDIDLDVIGNCPPRSICGSGLIDAVAVMLDLGIIDATGRFRTSDELRSHLAPLILARLIMHDDQPAFCLADSTKTSETKIVLSQKDIRHIQLAKAAIRAGTMLLQKKFGLEDNDIEQVLLAGAFGNYIRRQSALRIGLLPQVPLERIRFVGNAASSGAQMILLSRQSRMLAAKLARKIEYVEIAHEKDFSEVFTDSMFFPT